MELREVEHETDERVHAVVDIAQEVIDHMTEVALLHGAVEELRAAQSGVDSDGLREALQEADKAERALEQRMTELRGRRDELVQKNDALMERLSDSLMHKRKASARLHQLSQGLDRAAGQGTLAATRFYARMERAMSEDLSATAKALQDAQDVALDLEGDWIKLGF